MSRMNFKCSNGPIRPSTTMRKLSRSSNVLTFEGSGLAMSPAGEGGHLRIASRSKKDDTGNKEPTLQAFHGAHLDRKCGSAQGQL